MSQEGSPGYHFFAHLPQYWRKSVSGGQSGVSFPSHLAWYCGKIVPGDTLNALPAAIFAGERVRRSVRGIIFPAIHGRLSRPFEADSPAPPSLRPHRHPCRTATHPPHLRAVMPAPPREKNPAGANLSVRPRIPLSSSPLCPRQRRGEVPGGSDPAKKYEKKVQKNLEVREKAVPLQSRSERGAPEMPRGERK